MKKMAIFVEGQTEQIFVEKLLKEIAGEKNIEIEVEKFKGEGGGKYSFVVMKTPKNKAKKRFYVLIRDCCNDEQVKTTIKDSLITLNREKYEKVIGLRDVYPKKHYEIKLLKRALEYGLPQNLVPTKILLAIMEIEAWFLSEVTHFEEIDKKLNLKFIKKNLNFDPEKDNIQKRYHPSEDLNKIYQLVNKTYNKSKRNVERTVNVLDYSIMYLVLPGKMSSLSDFITHIDNFLN